MQSLSRALTVLAELNRQDRAYGVTELAVAVGLHKSTVHRILATFCEHGLARRVDDHLYSAADGFAALRRPANVTRGPEHALTELSEKLVRLVVLARPLRNCAASVVLEVTATAGDCAVRPGDAVSLRRSALGRAYLSAIPADGVDGTPELLESLRRTREAGFAHNPRPVASLPRMVAVPVRDASGRCSGALGAELTQAGSIEEIRRVLPALRFGARRLDVRAAGRPVVLAEQRRGA